MHPATNTHRIRALLSTALVALLLCSGVVQARSDSGARLLRLHLPVHLEGSQTVRLDRLVLDHYDLDLDAYVLRGIVIESDGYTDRRDAYARLQVGRYRTGRVHISSNQTSIDAPLYRSSQWQLRLGSGVRAHGLLLVLEEATYARYRTRPHAGTSLGLGWYLSDYNYRYPDFYHRDRYRYRALRSYDPFYDRHRNGRDRYDRRHHNHRRHDNRRYKNRRHEKRSHENRRHENRRHNEPATNPAVEHRQWRAGTRPGARDRSARPSRERSQRRQQQQAQRALRDNHEHARRPDRPQRARITPPQQPRAAQHRAPTQRAPRPRAATPAPQRAPRASQRSERRSAVPSRSRRAQAPRSGSSRNHSKRVHQ